MKHLHLRVINEVGLHARPAAVFVKEAGRFESDIRVRNATMGTDWVDAKSILGVLTLGVEKDHEIELLVEGSDEAEATASLEELIRTDFAGRL
ncbi:MAG TPA: HPr family phosphocarrier protein [Chloroflexi bacterium]|nr:HPr family phosphocarrier protein [Chloroflexota bacterium]